MQEQLPHADVQTTAVYTKIAQQDIREGLETTFRSDLYFRLSVFPIEVPPLRDRREDIPLLVWAFIARRQVKLRRRIERVPKRAMEALMTYAWPGNVRNSRM